jgi:hypothetical protein
VRANPSEEVNYDRNTAASPSPWDFRTNEPPLSREGTLRAQIAHSHEGSTGIPSRSNSLQRHTRNDSSGTGMNSIPEYVDGPNSNSRKHDYDVQSMETSLGSPRAVRNPIPAPSVTVRSEFPTLTRSRQQQSLTCLITIEIPEGKWRPTPEDVRSRPPLPGGSSSNAGEYNAVRSPGVATQHSNPQFDSQPSLDEVTEELHARVDNWHGLDFSRFGKLRLHSHIRVGKDRRAWQDLDCYLFSEMLICVKERKVSRAATFDEPSSVEADKPRCTLKGSILIKKHLKEVETFPGKFDFGIWFCFPLILKQRRTSSR